jgi:hypothetical protein
VRFIAGNALSGADTTMITVTDVPDVSNLCGNPSFETNTTGWNGTGSGVLSRVAGGQDGSWAVKVQGPATTAEFGMNDSPNWLLTINAGVRYRYTVWVKSSVGAGRARLKLREYLNSTQVGSSVTSPTLILNTSTWQQLSADFVAQSTGSTLDFQVLNLPNTPSESFFIDNVVIAVVPPSGATPLALAEVSGAPRATETSRIQALPFAQSIRVRPQPMAAAGAIEFNLDHAGPVDVRLYDAAGREVRALLRMTHAEPQRFVVQVPRAATSGARLAAGVYFFRIQCASGRARGRLVISD